MVDKICNQCKREFKTWPSRIRKGRKYCSDKCKGIAYMGSHHSPKTEFKKGLLAWNKNKKFPKMSGKNHWHWRGGATPINKLERERFRKTMQKQIFERDDYICQICGVKGKDLQVDHIQPWAEYIELRFSIENCRTLCASCHYEITFGKPMPKNIKGWGHNLLKEGTQN